MQNKKETQAFSAVAYKKETEFSHNFSMSNRSDVIPMFNIHFHSSERKKERG
jgi:hypothetical protein